MTWFRVDDAMALSPAVLAAGNRAMGLWVRAGAWSAQHLTEGHVPATVVRLLGGTRADTTALVDAGLWQPDGDDWAFRDWAASNPSKEQVEADRAAAAARQRRARDTARARAAEATAPPPSRRDTPAPVTPPSRRDSRPCHAVSHGPPIPSHTDKENAPPAVVRRPAPAAPPGAPPDAPAAAVPDGPPAPAEDPPGGAPPTAQRLVAAWLDRCARRPPARIVARVGAQVATLLAEGIPAADVAAGLHAWHDRRLDPSTLPSVVNELMQGPPVPRTNGRAGDGRGPHRPSTTDARVAAGLALTARYAAAEGHPPPPDPLALGAAP